jgi:hypothetical protein
MNISKARKRYRHVMMVALKSAARRIEEAGCVEAFKDYLLDRFYMDHAKAELPDSAKEICRILAVDYGWGISDTSEYMQDFMRTVGLTAGFDEEDADRTVVPVHHWKQEGF